MFSRVEKKIPNIIFIDGSKLIFRHRNVVLNVVITLDPSIYDIKLRLI